MYICVSSSLVRGPGVFGEVLVYWNITPAAVSQFEEISGTVTMRDRQSAATITLKVLHEIDCTVCKNNGYVCISALQNTPAALNAS